MTEATRPRWSGADLILPTRIQPRASRDAWVLSDDLVKLRVTAPPVDGAANTHIQRFIAEAFGVPKSQVELVKGQTSRCKVFRIREPTRVPAELAALVAHRSA